MTDTSSTSADLAVPAASEPGGDIVALADAPPAEQQQIKALLAELDLTDAGSVMHFGAKAQQQLRPTSGRGEWHRGRLRADKGRRMRIKREHNGLGRKTRGHLLQLGDDCRMADVHAIEQQIDGLQGVAPVSSSGMQAIYGNANWSARRS